MGASGAGLAAWVPEVCSEPLWAKTCLLRSECLSTCSQKKGKCGPQPSGTAQPCWQFPALPSSSSPSTQFGNLANAGISEYFLSSGH